MNRRSFLRGAAAAGCLGGAGCIGGGGEIVTNIQREISVKPGEGWSERIPAVLDNGGAVSYVTRARLPYDVYFFTSEAQMRAYRAFTDGEEPDRLPTGDRSVGRTATPVGERMHKATSKNDGGRQEIEGTGPYYFVLDNSDYPAAGGAYPSAQPSSRSIFLDLTVTRKRFGLPF